LAGLKTLRPVETLQIVKNCFLLGKMKGVEPITHPIFYLTINNKLQYCLLFCMTTKYYLLTQEKKAD
jgi:hypothetical protein